MLTYNNLPGVYPEIQDGGLSADVDTNYKETESVLIIGTAVDGPSNVVYKVKNVQDAIGIFGHFRDTTGVVNGTSLVRGIIEASKTGCKDIRALRIGGKKANGAAKIGSTGYSLYAESKYAGDLYNGAKVEIKMGVTPKVVVFTKPSSKVISGEPASYKLADLLGVQEADVANAPVQRLINAINGIVYNNFVNFALVDSNGNDVTMSIDATVQAVKVGSLGSSTVTLELIGGDSGINSAAIEKYMMIGGYVKEHNLENTTVTTVDSSYVPTTTKLGYENPLMDLLADYKVDNVVVLDALANVGLNTQPIAQNFRKAYVYIDGVEGLYVETLDGSTNKTISITTGASLDVTVATNNITVTAPTGTLYAEIARLLNTNANTKSIVKAYGGKSTFKANVASTKILGRLFTTEDTFARQIAQMCAVVSARTSECIGIIGCTPAPATDLISLKNYVNDLLGLTAGNTVIQYVSDKYDLYLKDEYGNYVLGTDGKRIDIGGFLNIVAGPDLVYADEYLSAYAVNGASAYAGLISTLKPEFSTTNKKVNGIIGLRYELSAKQLSDLTEAGYVTFRNSYNLGIVVTDGVTAAGVNSDFRRLTTKRITSAVVNVVRSASEPFVGLPNNLAERNALSTAIQAALDAMKNAGAIQDFKFDVYASKLDQRLGNAVVDLTIVPTFEFRRIRVLVNLKNQL